MSLLLNSDEVQAGSRYLASQEDGVPGSRSGSMCRLSEQMQSPSFQQARAAVGSPNSSWDDLPNLSWGTPAL